MATVHNFADSLARAQSYADAAWWRDIYRAAFGDKVKAAIVIREDGWAQRGGVDRVLTLSSGQTFYVDEKVREEDWSDILLEYWSDREAEKPGWIEKDLACDFIAYAFLPSRTCYLLSFPALRSAWKKNCETWKREFHHVEARNDGYTTESIAIPIDVLLRAMSDAMTVKWTVGL